VALREEERGAAAGMARTRTRFIELCALQFSFNSAVKQFLRELVLRLTRECISRADAKPCVRYFDQTRTVWKSAAYASRFYVSIPML
jgi:hypothetical protein